MFLHPNIFVKYGELEFDDFIICTLLHSSLPLRIVSVRYNGLQRHFKHHPRQSMLSRMLLWQLISHHIKYVEGISPACLPACLSICLSACLRLCLVVRLHSHYKLYLSDLIYLLFFWPCFYFDTFVSLLSSLHPSFFVSLLKSFFFPTLTP